MKALVFLDGAYEDPGFYAARARGAGLVVAADGGARFLLAQGLLPSLVVGDLDSLPPADAARLAGEGVEFLVHPVRKDQTDGELAVDEALRRGADEVVLAGALGALDHTLGHLAILWRLAKQGVRASVLAPALTVRVVIAPGRVGLDAAPGTRVSVVPLGGDAVVTLVGFDYPLDHGVLPGDACLGLGNTIVAEPLVTVHQGATAVVVEDGDEGFPDGSCARR